MKMSDMITCLECDPVIAAVTAPKIQCNSKDASVSPTKVGVRVVIGFSILDFFSFVKCATNHNHRHG